MEKFIRLMDKSLEMDELEFDSLDFRSAGFDSRSLMLKTTLRHLERSDGEDTSSDGSSDDSDHSDGSECSDGSDTETLSSSELEAPVCVEKEIPVCPPPTIDFFEGAEKRLALYVAPSSMGALNSGNTAVIGNGESEGIKLDSLRQIPLYEWEKILDVVNCRILNIISNDSMDAYLLSESSMFVADDHLIIKTCGSTTLLHCLKPMLNLFLNFGFNMIEDVFFSHKNLLAPALQPQPHDSFTKESNCLEDFFTGNSQVFGCINSDRWYFYTADDTIGALGHAGNPTKVFNSNEHFKFEMIMEELDSKAMGLFFRTSPGQTATEVTLKSGIHDLVPGMVIDDFLFTPCGYSMNGLLGKYYMTIHITPESDFSYVSLETNLPQESYPDFIAKVAKIFIPGKFMINIMLPNNLDEMSGMSAESEALRKELLAGFTNSKAGFRYYGTDFQLAHYKDLDVIYTRYVSEGYS